jgi:hypothetical protein
MYLNRWTPNFDTDIGIPSTLSIWVHIPHLPLHYWGDDVLKVIGNAIDKYIDKA